MIGVLLLVVGGVSGTVITATYWSACVLLGFDAPDDRHLAAGFVLSSMVSAVALSAFVLWDWWRHA